MWHRPNSSGRVVGRISAERGIVKLQQILHRLNIIVRVGLCCICLSHLDTNEMISGTVHDLHQKFCSYEASLNTN